MKFKKFIGLFIIILILSTNFAFASSISQFDGLKQTIKNDQNSGHQSKMESTTINDIGFIEKKEDDKYTDKYKMKHFKWYQFYYPIVYGIKYVIDSIIGFGGYGLMGAHAISGSASDDDSTTNSVLNDLNKVKDYANQIKSNETNLSNNNTNETPELEDINRTMIKLREADVKCDVKNVVGDNLSSERIERGNILQYIINVTGFDPIYRYFVVMNRDGNVLNLSYLNVSSTFSDPSYELNYSDGYMCVDIADISKFNNNTVKYIIDSPYPTRTIIDPDFDYLTFYAYDTNDEYTHNYRDPTHLKNKTQSIPTGANNTLLDEYNSDMNMAIASIVLSIINIVMGVVILVLAVVGYANPTCQAVATALFAFGLGINIICIFLDASLCAEFSKLWTGAVAAVLGGCGTADLSSIFVAIKEICCPPPAPLIAPPPSISVSTVVAGITITAGGILSLITAGVCCSKFKGLYKSEKNKDNTRSGYIDSLNNIIEAHNIHPSPMKRDDVLVYDMVVNASSPMSNIPK